MADFNNPFWQGVPYAPETLPPEVLQQLAQQRSLMGQSPQQPPQQMLGAQQPMTIQVPDIQYSDAMKKQALSQGLMSAGLNMLSNMHPTALPQSPFASIGQAGLAGMQTYQGNLDNKMKQALEFARAQSLMTPKSTPLNDFGTFYNGYITDHPAATKAEIDKAWGDEVIRRNAARATEFAKTRGVTVIDPKAGQPVPMSWSEINEMAKNGQRPTAAQYSPEVKQSMAEAGQRGGMRSANVRTAYDVFSKEAPELVALRSKVQAKGMLPSGGLKDVNALNQWMGMKTSDPDVAELQKKTKLLADTLQRTIGGTQGGQWAFEVAADILDPTYDPAAFERIMSSHTKTFGRMAEAYKNFGKEGQQTGVPATSGMTEGQARKALSDKGITGTAADGWIAKYRAAGKIQ